MRWSEQQLTDHLERRGVPGAPNTADTSWPPFALPDIVVHLPYPPSVNRLWRASAAHGERSVYLAPSYVKWKSAADQLLTSTRGWSQMRITGAFSIDLALCPPKNHPRGDLDNRIKAVLDFLQRVNVISNDRHCQRLVAEWATSDIAPHGCRATLRPCA